MSNPHTADESTQCSQLVNVTLSENVNAFLTQTDLARTVRKQAVNDVGLDGPS